MKKFLVSLAVVVLTFVLNAGTALAVVPAPAPVPEPGTFVLLGAGLIGIFALARKRMKK